MRELVVLRDRTCVLPPLRNQVPRPRPRNRLHRHGRPRTPGQTNPDSLATP